MAVGEKQKIRFGPFEFDPDSGELFKNSHKLKLEGQPAQVLAILLERPKALISREEFFKRLWPADTFVDSERILNADIWKLRQVLGDAAEHPRYIETLPKRGYRFICEEPVPTEAPSTTTVPFNRGRKLVAKILIIVLPAAVVLFGLTYWYSGLRAPKIVGTHRLTNTGVQKSRSMPVWCFLATDGARVYFQEHRSANKWAIAQVSVNGGEISDLETPFIGFQCLHDIKADSSELLVTEFRRETGWSPWGIPLPTGAPRKYPVAAGSNWVVWSRDGRSLFYSSNGDKQLNRLDVSSGISTRLLTAPDITYPRVSPDGSRIRFTALVSAPGTGEYLKDERIWETNIDGSNLHRFFDEPEAKTSFGDWTPDGKLFFFYKHEGTSSSLWAMSEKRRWFDLRSAKPTLLYAGPLELHSAIASRDGKKLFVIGADPKAELVVLNMATGNVSPFLSGIPACFVSFSPDRKWVAYVTYPDGNLWRSRVDGTDRLQLTFAPMGVLLPRWSPDGKLIVFMDWYSGENHKIYAVSPDGGNPSLLLSGEFQPGDPSWSPDGQSIAYGACGCPWSEVRIYDLRSGTSKTIPKSEGYFSPRWSPDGRFIVAIDSRTSNLMLFDFVTDKWKMLSPPGYYGLPEWSHNGRYVYASGPTGIVRINAKTRQEETVTDLHGIRWTAFRFRMLGWFGLTPDDRIMILRDTGSEDIYALDLEY
jgi:Tol biopolymer transport system component/DNA-binding winged helix-turn-helix (wHTH) protein